LPFKRRPASFRVGGNMASSTKVFGVDDKRLSLKPERFDGFLSVAAMVLLAFVFAALFRGRAQWSHVPLIVWAHLVTIVIATALTPIMLLRRRGDWVHRRLGWLWASAMALTALLTFGIRGLNGGGLSFIHILSAWTLVQVPVIIWTARSHQVARHRSAVRGMVTGALIIAGVFTFPFSRLLGRWLFGCCHSVDSAFAMKSRVGSGVGPNVCFPPQPCRCGWSVNDPIADIHSSQSDWIQPFATQFI